MSDFERPGGLPSGDTGRSPRRPGPDNYAFPQERHQPPPARRPPQRPRRRVPWWKSNPAVGGAALLVGLVIGAILGSWEGDTKAAAARPGPTVTVNMPALDEAPEPAVTVTAPAPPAKTVPGPVRTVTAVPTARGEGIKQDGTWLVGQDVRAGTYRSSGRVDCYWARLSDTSGEDDEIIANGNGRNQVVTLKKSDNAFQSTRCAPWTRLR